MNKRSKSKGLASKKHKKEIKRKSKRKEGKILKTEIKRKLRVIETAISLFPDSCASCGSMFSGSDLDLDSWKLDIVDSDMTLTCDKCIDGN